MVGTSKKSIEQAKQAKKRRLAIQKEFKLSGMNKGEFARFKGISRQMLWKLFREVREK